MRRQGTVPAPNFTPVPNVWFDEIMPHIETAAELKVTLTIFRSTFGWAEGAGRKLEDKLSWSQIAKRSGLSRQSVVNGLKAGMDRGTIGRKKDGKGYKYHLVIDPALVKELDRETVQTLDPSAAADGTNLRPSSVQTLDPSTVKTLDPQNKEKKEKKKSDLETSRAASAGASGDAHAAPPSSPTDKVYIPIPFPIDEEVRAWAGKTCPLVDLDDATDKFVLQYSPEAVNDPPMYTWALWVTKWKTWVRREQKFELRDGLPTNGDAPRPKGKPDYALTDDERRRCQECPDCHGTGMWYPGGYDKGVAKCTHERMPRANVKHVDAHEVTNV